MYTVKEIIEMNLPSLPKTITSLKIKIKNENWPCKTKKIGSKSILLYDIPSTYLELPYYLTEMDHLDIKFNLSFGHKDWHGRVIKHEKSDITSFSSLVRYIHEPLKVKNFYITLSRALDEKAEQIAHELITPFYVSNHILYALDLLPQDVIVIRVFNDQLSPKIVKNKILLLQLTLNFIGQGVYLFECQKKLHLARLVYVEDRKFAICWDYPTPELTIKDKIKIIGIVRWDLGMMPEELAFPLKLVQ